MGNACIHYSKEGWYQGAVHFITDYCKVNKSIKRKTYPLPRIANMLQKLEGFQFTSALDLNMGIYTI
jgi:hypothetical protein